METSNSGANHADSHAQNGRRGMGPIENSNSDAKVAVLKVQNHR